MNDTYGSTEDNYPHRRDADPLATIAPGDVTNAPRQSLPASRLASAVTQLGPHLILATQDQGYTAALNGNHVDTCPWRSANTERDAALRQMWVRGYSAGRTDLRIARDRRSE